MEKDNDILDDQLNGDIFDLDLDDLSMDEVEKETGVEEPDEDIIELIDLVENGDGDLDEVAVENEEYPDLMLESNDLLSDLEEDKVDYAAASQPDIDLSNIAPEPEASPLDYMESGVNLQDDEIAEEDFEKLLQDTSDSELDLTLDSPLEEKDSFEDLLTEADLLEEGPEDENIDAIILEEDISEKDFASLLDESPGPEPEMNKEIPITEEAQAEELVEETIHEEQIDDSRISSETPAEAVISISEEKIEAIVERVVGSVVERIARETMAEVAEKLISEAIDSLKKSLESNAD